MNKKQTLAIAVYVAGMFFTNSYCLIYRWNDWLRPERYYVDETAKVRTTLATAFWPIYWTSRGCTALVQSAANVEFCIKSTGESE